MWKNIVEPGRPQITWRMRIALWIPKVTNTHSKYDTYFFSASTMVARTGLIVTLYISCLFCFIEFHPNRKKMWNLTGIYVFHELRSV